MPLNPIVAAAMTESDVEAEVRTAMQALNCDILVNTVRVTNKRRRSASTGQTKGIPDWSVRKRTWPLALWLLMELKRPVGGKLSDEQQLIHDRGGSIVVCCAEDAVSAVLAVDEELKARREAA